jgi:polyisoprenoid-binding protein YceI
MTNYLAILGATLSLFAAACHASQDAGTLTAIKPTAAAPAISAAPAPGAASAAAPASAAPALPRYTQNAAKSSLKFTFEQAGAAASGSFRKFTTVLLYDEKNLAASSLDVRVEIASLDTQEQERDGTLKDADLFNAAKFPAATFAASSLAKRADGGLEAVGKLTIRDITHNLRLPITLKPTPEGFDLSGKIAIKRLDYGVGQGEWKATDSVSDEVKIEYTVSLVRSRS